MIRYLLIFLSVMLLASCEDTNVFMMTEATTEAVVAITLSDEEVQDLARRSALDLDSKHIIAPVGNTYDKRLQKLIAGHTQRDGKSFDYKVYLANEVFCHG